MSGFGPNNDVAGWARVGKYLSDVARVIVPGSAQLLRGTQYGDQGVQSLWSKPIGVASEGSYYLTRNPTVETGLATIAALATFADTSPFIIVTNNNPVGGRDIYLDYIKLINTAAGTGGTNLRYATKVDVIQRYSSGGAGGFGTNILGATAQLQGPLPTNTGAPAGSGALIYAGALVAVAGSLQQRVLESGPIRTTINVVNDQLTWTFGDAEKVNSDLAIATATAIQKTIPHPPVCIAPGHSFLFHIFAASQSAAASWEVIIGHVER